MPTFHIDFQFIQNKSGNISRIQICTQKSIQNTNNKKSWNIKKNVDLKYTCTNKLLKNN